MANSICTAVDATGKIIIIDLNKLRGYNRLKDATIFNKLFKLNEESEFGNFPMRTNDKGQITLLQFLDISFEDWSNLILFLENGLYLINYMNLNDSVNLIENLNSTCNKLGGIPDFDDFYKHYNRIIQARIQIGFY